MSAVKRGLLAALLVLTVGVCGQPIDSVTGFCDEFGAALCAQLQACPTVPQPIMGECKPAIAGQLCYCAMNAIANGSEKYHGEKVQPCLDALKRLGCGAVSESAWPPECGPVYGLASGALALCPVIIGPLPDGSHGGSDK